MTAIITRRRVRPLARSAAAHEAKRLVRSGRACRNSRPLTDAQRRLAADSIGLVGWMYKRLVRNPYFVGVPLDELMSACNLGLVKAARTFDPTKGARFSSYARMAMESAARTAAALAGRRRCRRLVVDPAAPPEKEPAYSLPAHELLDRALEALPRRQRAAVRRRFFGVEGDIDPRIEAEAMQTLRAVFGLPPCPAALR